MATKKAETKLQKVDTNTALAKFEEQIKRLAEAATTQEANDGGGQFFSLRSGQLTWGGNQMPGNEMIVVVLDSILENVLYEDDFNPDQPATPVCFAFGRDKKTLAPHKDATKPQCAGCAACELNRWGSAAKGRGKACKNRRRMALVPAGVIDQKTGEATPYTDVVQFTDGQVGYLALPPTSINGWAQYVKQLGGALNLAPCCVYTKISLVPDTKTQFRVQFACLGALPRDVMQATVARNAEIASGIDFPYKPAPVTPPKKATAGAGKKARKF